MKGFVLIFFVSICFLNVRAQKIHFTDSMNQWYIWHEGPDGYWGTGYLGFTSDTIIGGFQYRILSTVNWSGGASWLPEAFGFREDSLGVYIRALSDGYPDTAERIYLDYTKNVGDTFSGYCYDTFQSYSYLVYAVDSTVINGVWHKVWHYVDAANGYPYFEVIEGVGSTWGPVWMECPWVFENMWWLLCFTTNDSHPIASPPVHEVALYADSIYYYCPTCGWRNDTCYYPVGSGMPGTDSGWPGSPGWGGGGVGVHTPVKANDVIHVFPQPGGLDIVLQCPAGIGACELRVYDASGKMMISLEESRKLIPIGRMIFLDGLYFYTLRDSKTGRLYTGKFIFRN